MAYCNFTLDNVVETLAIWLSQNCSLRSPDLEQALGPPL